jgi:hypothetical protein
MRQEQQPETTPVHAKFDAKMELLAAASVGFEDACAHLLRGLLHPDPSHRLTLREALSHSFLTDSFAEVPVDRMPAEVEDEEGFMGSARECSPFDDSMPDS